MQARGPSVYEVALNGDLPLRISTDREKAKEDENLSLLGLEHPLVRRLTEKHRQLDASERGVVGRLAVGNDLHGAVSVWRVEIHSSQGQVQQKIVTIGLNPEGERSRLLERLADRLRELQPCDQSVFTHTRRTELARSTVPEMIRRELCTPGFWPKIRRFRRGCWGGRR